MNARIIKQEPKPADWPILQVIIHLTPEEAQGLLRTVTSVRPGAEYMKWKDRLYDTLYRVLVTKEGG